MSENKSILKTKSYDFALRIVKLSQFLVLEKKANETDYWLNLLKDSNYLSIIEFESLEKDCLEIVKLLVATVKTSKLKVKS